MYWFCQSLSNVITFNSETLRSYCIICLLNHRCQFHCLFICYLQKHYRDNKKNVWIVSKKFIITYTNHFQTWSYIFVLPITFKRDHIYLFYQSLSNVITFNSERQLRRRENCDVNCCWKHEWRNLRGFRRGGW